MAGALTKLPELPEWLDPAMMAKHGWPGWSEALRAVHRPDALKSLSYGAPPRQRLAYDELLSHQLALQIARARMRRGKGQVSIGDGALRARAVAAFGYPPTAAQHRVIGEVVEDMGAPERMIRLLQGDVGSGKTWVALMGMLVAAEAGGQGALMAGGGGLVGAGVGERCDGGRRSGARGRDRADSLRAAGCQAIPPLGAPGLFVTIAIYRT